MVVVLSMIKELVADVARQMRDASFNNLNVCQWNPSKNTWDIKANKQVRVGDLIQVKDWVPADCIVVNTLSGSDELFVKTDQLDGETDWKQKRCLNFTYKRFNKNDTKDKFFFEQDYKNQIFECEKPNREIYSFAGRMTYKNAKTIDEIHEGIDIDNCIWANTKVTSGAVYAVVI